MAYLGTLGHMVELQGINSQSVAAEDRYTFKRTVEGRVKAQDIPVARRAWALSTKATATAAQVAAIMAFASGAWGRGPFWFVSADAPHTNLLTPGASTCDPADVTMSSGATLLGSPPLLTPDGWAARSIWKDTGNGAFFGAAVPVLPGVRVTGSAYVAGSGGYVRLVFLNAAGSVVGQADSANASPTVGRRSVTAIPPAAAVSARLTVSASVTAAAMPAITWTNVVQPWSDGQGCAKAILHGASRDLGLAVQGATYSSVSFTVTEVG